MIGIQHMPAESEWKPFLKKCVIAVGGGKGGTGKSLLATNLGIALAELRQNVILIDLDLGGANLHTCLGIRSAEATLGDFLQKKAEHLEKILLPTPVDRLKFINGSNDPLEIANLPYTRKVRLIKHIKQLQADYIILDLGGGTSLNVLDFFLSADYGIVVATPEPTSMENVSLFIKCFMMRHLKILLKQFPISNLKNRIKDPRNRDTLRTFTDLLRLIRSFDQGTAGKIEKKLEGFKFGLILNMLREHGETRIGGAYKSMINRCMGIQMDHLGQIYYDEKIPLAVKNFEPFMVKYPHAKASHSIRLTAKRILGIDHLSSTLHQWPPLFAPKHTERSEPAASDTLAEKSLKEKRAKGLRFYL